jgi:hypothetical protein
MSIDTSMVASRMAHASWHYALRFPRDRQRNSTQRPAKWYSVLLRGTLDPQITRCQQVSELSSGANEMTSQPRPQHLGRAQSTVDDRIALEGPATQSVSERDSIAPGGNSRPEVSRPPVAEPRGNLLAGLQQKRNLCWPRWQDVLPQTAEA